VELSLSKHIQAPHMRFKLAEKRLELFD